MFVTHLLVIIVPQIFGLSHQYEVPWLLCITHWSPKLTMSSAPMHIHFVGYIRLANMKLFNLAFISCSIMRMHIHDLCDTKIEMHTNLRE